MATTVGSALTADGIKNTVIGLGGLSFGTMISSAGGVAVGAPVAVASGALTVAGAVESAYGATVLLSSARNMGSDMQKLGDAMSSPEDAGSASNNIADLAKDMKSWLGKDARVITNKNGDKIFISGDGTKRIRFDINNTSPHNNPHGHVEELVNGKWVKSGPVYPIDVPHN